MLFPTTSLLIEADRHESACENMEEYAQNYARVAHFPTLRDRLTYQAGKLFIDIGEKMTASSLKHMPLTGKMA
ncbi:MAG TPA: hypothetical protein VMC09_12840 [Anaerolineales bacterium]|nr:hypothetical protein [Anaerolineales bacterium]